MRLRRRPPTADPADGLSGVARLDRRTKDLCARLHPGNVAIIDHDDLDRISAESLLECGVAAVVNARPSISGRYPNLGPLILVTAGIPLLDDVGDGVFGDVAEGQTVHLVGSRLYTGGDVVAQGRLLDRTTVIERMDAARASLSESVERFAENTLDYVRREQDLLLQDVRLAELRTAFKGRHALVVTRGYHYKEDLATLRPYVREMRPVVVAVDGAADACLAAGVRPDLIVGDMDSVSPSALRCGAELVVHPLGEWRRLRAGGVDIGPPPAAEMIRTLGLDCHVLDAPGTSEDVAMLLAHEHGADLVVAVGSHTSMVEFLDKGRQGMASTFLVRMRLGPSLVDAKGVSQLYRTRVARRDLAALVCAAGLTMVIVSAISPPWRLFWGAAWELLTHLVFRIRSVL